MILLGWHFLGSKSSKPAASNPAAAPIAVAPAPAATRPAAPVPAAPPAAAVAATASHAGWYVIAYTYNREDQARTRAARLNARHSAVNAQVFSPSGHAPYLVSLGGAMSKDEARDVLRQARRSGMPRDTFVRRY